jgi:hypothetical protein
MMHGTMNIKYIPPHIYKPLRSATVVTFRQIITYTRKCFWAPRPTPMLLDQTLSAPCDCKVHFRSVSAYYICKLKKKSNTNSLLDTSNYSIKTSLNTNSRKLHSQHSTSVNAHYSCTEKVTVWKVLNSAVNLLWRLNCATDTRWRRGGGTRSEWKERQTTAQL